MCQSEPLDAVLESSRPIPYPPLSIENCSLKRPLAPLCSCGQAFGPHTNMQTHTYTHTHEYGLSHTLILGSECESDISVSPSGHRERGRRMSERITAGFIDSFPLLQKMTSVFIASAVFTHSYLFHTPTVPSTTHLKPHIGFLFNSCLHRRKKMKQSHLELEAKGR